MDWTTIKLCNTCGAGVPGDLAWCRRCGGSDFGERTPGVPGSGIGNFFAAAAAMRWVCGFLALVTMGWTLVLVGPLRILLTTVVRSGPPEGPGGLVLRADFLTITGGAIVFIGCCAAFVSASAARFAGKITSGDFSQYVDSVGLFGVTGSILWIGVACLYGSDVRRSAVGAVACLNMALFLAGNLVAAKALTGLAASLGHQRFERRGRQVIREWWAVLGGLVIVAGFVMLSGERPDEWFIIGILVVSLLLFIIYATAYLAVLAASVAKCLRGQASATAV